MFLKKRRIKIALAFFLASQFFNLSLFFGPKKLDSANLTNVSDSLSNNRLSFRGQLEGAVAVGSGVITLETTIVDMLAENTSTGSAALMANENLKVGLNAPIAVKTIDDAASRVILETGLTTAATDKDPVVATSSAIHTVSFTPVSAVPNGAFRVLIPAGTTTANDGLPDKNGFDIGESGDEPPVLCSGGSGIDIWETGTATASGATGCTSPANFHCFECRYSGNGGSGTAITMTIGTPAGNKLINPSPASMTRYPGEADTYTYRVRHIYGTVQSYSTLDETLGKIGVVEAVRVTATVSPTLTFQITGRAADTTSCGQATPTGIGTTYNSVPFGTTISTTAFANLAQQLLVSTNAAGGYTVTASESAQLTAWNITGTPTIPDTTCQAAPCTTTTPQTWTDTSYKGFGYTLEDIKGDAVADSLEYANGYRPFGTTGVQIMRANPAGPVDSDMAYVCYRIVVSGTQAAGDYENYVIYIATATF